MGRVNMQNTQDKRTTEINFCHEYDSNQQLLDHQAIILLLSYRQSLNVCNDGNRIVQKIIK